MVMAISLWSALLATTILSWLLLTQFLAHAVQSDIDCLRSIIESLEDPENNVFRTWNFHNRTEGAICYFTGVQCWHDNENRVLNIRLGSMGLRGKFPLGIIGCSCMSGLDLSGNNLRGNIPNNISHIIGFVTELDLSSNQFSGEIPADIANCTYLNTLRLDNNQFTGQIPWQIGLLNRLTEFTVTRNRLSGPVPQFVSSNSTFGASSYAGNLGLCGSPLPPCTVPPRPLISLSRTAVIYVVVVVGMVILGISMFLCLLKLSWMKKEEDRLNGIYRTKKKKKKGEEHRRLCKKKEEEQDHMSNKWAKRIKGAKRIKLSMFEKSASKMSLDDLMKATNDFSKENIIGSGSTGTMYSATLEDGTSLIIKRLQDIQHSEKQFKSEMATLGNIKHQNLTPLLCYCITKKERLLVYESMPNGTLYDKLHNETKDAKLLDWPLRLKIGIGAARGFSWLHHSCNPRIIHRNISSKCILLDANYEPKIYDFGLVRLVMNPSDAHWSSLFANLGYVAATPVGDVFSFGLVLLELVTGEKPTYVTKASESFEGNLVEWITQLSSSSRLHDAIDSCLVNEGNENDEVLKFLEVACRCVLPGHERPTMFEVYQLLSGIGQHYGFTTEDDSSVLSDLGSSSGGDRDRL